MVDDCVFMGGDGAKLVPKTPVKPVCVTSPNRFQEAGNYFIVIPASASVIGDDPDSLEMG
jgi:hypothetical protein